MKKPVYNDALIKMLVFTFIFVLAEGILAENLAITTTESLPYHIFVLNKDTRSLKKGDYVLVHGFKTPLVNKGETFSIIKRITCFPGDRLEVLDRVYFCNGKPIAKAKEKSLKGEKLKAFVFNGLIPEKTYFISSDHPDSFDSRYFGMVVFPEIAAIASPVI